MQTTLKLEDFGSKGLLRILGTVYQHGPLNIGTLSRRTGMNHSNVDTHLKKLVEFGLVEERRYERTGMRMIAPSVQAVIIQLSRGNKVAIETR